MDPRLTPYNGRVAHVSLRGQVEADTFTHGDVRHIAQPVEELLDAKGNRQCELVWGEPFRVLEDTGGQVFGIAEQDGYVGWLDRGSAPWMSSEPTHWITAPRAMTLEQPDVTDGGAPLVLAFGSRVTEWPFEDPIAAERLADKGWMRIKSDAPGPKARFVRASQVHTMTEPLKDPAACAEAFLHTPYHWGGNTGFGIDCSGLVQRCLMACGIPCPRDSDMQAKAFAAADPQDLKRGDLVFWKGHVGMMLDGERLIHANAHHMAVAIEPLAGAIDRIGAKEFGAVTGYGRPA